MKSLFTFSLAALMAVSALGQNTTKGPGAQTALTSATVSSKGQDVRDVLHDLFTQAKKSYVIEPNTHFALYLSLNDIDFDEALQLICKTAGLKYELQNGIYFVSRDHTAQPTPAPAAKPTGKLSPLVLRKKVSLKAQKLDIRDLFKAFSEQTGLAIEVDPKIPAYKLDVLLHGTSLKFALETVCKAAGLTYRFTDSLSIEIIQMDSINRVSLHGDTGVQSP